MNSKASIHVRIKEMTDAQALEAQLVEDLIHTDVHPMDEAQGFMALFDLEEPTYSMKQIAAKTGKQSICTAAPGDGADVGTWLAQAKIVS